MAYEIHVLPLGFDIHRLTAPLTAKGSDFEPDEVILLYATTDGFEKDEAERTPSEKLVENTFSQTKRTLEDQVQVPTEIRELPDLTDYSAVYEAAYRLLDELSEPAADTDIEREVYVNISSLPNSAALAVSNAATALSFETPSKGSHIHIYYIPPEEYLEVQLLEFISEARPILRNAVEVGEEFWDDIEYQVYETISEALRDTLTGLVADIEELRQQLESTDHSNRSDQWQDDITEAIERATELKKYGTYDWVVREEPHNGGPHPTLLREKYSRRDLEAEQNALTAHIEAIRSAVQKATEEGVADDVVSRIDRTLKSAEQSLRGYAAIQWWATVYPSTYMDIQGLLSDAEMHVEEVERYGMTKGVGTSGGQIQTPISVPPVASLRDMELLVLYVLADEEMVESIGTLAQQIAGSLRRHVESFRLDGEQPSDTIPEFVSKITPLLEQRDKDDVLNMLESEMADRIRSRLQYNIESLEDNQYVRRVEGADSRRTQISLTKTGEQWVRTHDVPAVCREPMENILSKEIKKFAVTSS